MRTHRAVVKSSSPRRILWAVDVFAGPVSSKESRVALLKLLASKKGTRIEPVYVLSPNGLNFSLPIDPAWAGKYRFAAESSFQALLKDVHIPGLKKPKVLLQLRPSSALSNQALLAYARKSHADLIVAETHARSGVSRFLLGSFSEDLVLHSNVPLLISRPDAHIAPVKRILFPTDLEKSGLPLFKKVLAFAKDRGSSVRVIHVLTEPIEAALQAGATMIGGGWIGGTPRANVMSEKERLLERWAELAAKAGVVCDASVVCGEGNVAANILREAQSKESAKSCQMLALAAQSGPIAATLLGSVARQVIRQSGLPVWIIRNT